MWHSGVKGREDGRRKSVDERIGMDGWIGMELLKFPFDYVDYCEDLEVSGDGMV